MNNPKERKATAAKTIKQKNNESKATSSKMITVNQQKAKSNKLWTNNDKKILLEGLKKYGAENVEAISKMLPNMSFEDIKWKIAEYSEMAEYLYEHELINNWMNCGMFEPGDSLIPEALLFIHLFEKHPSPSEAEGFNFRAIYNFLYRSCLGPVSYFDLSPKDRDLLCILLSRLERKIWPKCEKDIWEYVGNTYNKRHIKKVYPGKRVPGQLL
ncbi:uncharacterized protein LOC117232127 [Bombus vosnesenskii]|uniref:Uncharacterized protein LOC117232127 n=1 Tax=Bombus vosnesenskii TaxID=207650 RepID=A0A6J3K4P5_9HYME|nr:uncharacterized protein LOC117232127 [Bombus vosnesenskii]XP_050475362.1 uncharacterized protein LOC126866160 [Bombus huntii]